MASNALADAIANVAIDARAARKRCAATADDDDDHDVPRGRDAVQRAKRQRTVVPVKTKMPDAMFVGDIDAPAAGGDGLPATRTSTTTRAMAAGIPATPLTAGCEWSATPLDFDAPATGLPLEDVAFATPLNFDWHPTATATTPTQSATMPLEHVPLYAKCNARADPLEANDGDTVDPVPVAAHEDSRPRMPFDGKTQFTPQWNALLQCELSAPGIDGPVLRPYGTPADAEADIACLYPQAPKDEDCMPRVLMGDWEVPMSAPVDLGGLAPPLLAEDAANIDPALWDNDRNPREWSPPLQPRVQADDAANLDPALWGEDRKPYVLLDEQRAAMDAPLGLGARLSADDLANLDEDCKPHVPLEEKRAAADASVDFQAANTPAPHAGNVAQLLAPAHADAPEDERTPYVPYHEKLEYITEWRRRVATNAPAPAPIEFPAPFATIPGAYYRADGVGIPVGDPRTRDWVPLPPYDAALDELAQYGAAPYEMPPMSPKTKRELEEFLAAGPGPFADDTPTGPRARVDMGLLTPEEEPQDVLDAAEHLALLDALLLDLQN